ncbi:MAG: hypothetical protein EOP56_12270 [Sphingobacteriales bacterium]|nr:MAG: hypothetical protein EOP56_12270 [Sphingobacteriales bacterium]
MKHSPQHKHETLHWRALKKALEPSPDEKLFTRWSAIAQTSLAVISIIISVYVFNRQTEQAERLGDQKDMMKRFDSLLINTNALLLSNVIQNHELHSILVKLDTNNQKSDGVSLAMHRQLELHSDVRDDEYRASLIKFKADLQNIQIIYWKEVLLATNAGEFNNTISKLLKHFQATSSSPFIIRNSILFWLWNRVIAGIDGFDFYFETTPREDSEDQRMAGYVGSDIRTAIYKADSLLNIELPSPKTP